MFDFQGLVDTAVSYALTTGEFDTVNAHEPKAPPGNGMTCSVWASSIHAVPSSGLASVSMLVELTMRVQTPSQVAGPLDAIDPLMMRAVATLMSTFAGGFTLSDTVRNVDLFGQHSQGLNAKPGYVTQNGTVYRVFDVSVSSIINDVLTEAP